VGDFVVIGAGEAFRRTLKERDGDHLDGVDRYRDAIDDLDDRRLGHYYVDPRGLIDDMLRQDPQQTQGLRELIAVFAVDRLGPVAGAFVADAHGLAIDSTVTGIPEGSLRELARLWSGGRSELMRELPGDAWAAFATPDVGESAGALLRSSARVFSGAVLTAGVTRATGLDLEHDVFPWVGEVGGFLRGTDASGLDFGLVIQATDNDRAAAAMRTLVGTLRRQSSFTPRRRHVPGAQSAFIISDSENGPLILARGNSRLVAAYGGAAAALRPDAALGDGGEIARAKDALGGGLEPTVLLSVPALIAVLDTAEIEYEDDVRPYLRTLDMVAAGGTADGDRMRSRIAATFR
jgi:hypothetical protein